MQRLSMTRFAGVPLMAGALGLASAAASAAENYLKIAGSDHFLFLRADGTVWGLGACHVGQLGPRSDKCVRVRQLRRIELPGRAVDIAAAHDASFALLDDGRVVSWGSDDDGRLGNGGPDVRWRPRPHRREPQAIDGLSGIRAIAAEMHYAGAIDGEGRLWTWGKKVGIVKGDATIVPTVAPQMVEGLPPVASVSFGDNYVLALARDGSVWAWGDNAWGQLGTGDTDKRAQPVRVEGLPPAVAACSDHDASLALMKDGTLRVWGRNTFGGHHDTTFVSYYDQKEPTMPRPVNVPRIAGAVSLACGHNRIGVILKDGTIRMWGYNGWGEMGAGKRGEYEPRPVKPNIAAVKGLYQLSSRTFALTADGTPYVWGASIRDLVGMEEKDRHAPTPFTVPQATEPAP